MIELHVTEPSPVALMVQSGGGKPEQVRDVTPQFEPVVVLPDAGMTLARVNVRAIPLSRTTNPAGGRTVYIGEI